MPKRPLGLSKSKGKGSAAPVSKKQKTTHEVEDSQSLKDDWEDLQELFARANATFVKGGTYCFGPLTTHAHKNYSDLPVALPLLRGVVHECDRIQRNTSEEELSKLAALESLHTGHTNSHSSFSSLYADALLHMGLIIGREPELIVEDEPDSAESYFEGAKTLLDERWPNKQIDDVRLQFTWANVLLLLADVAAPIVVGSDDGVDEEISEFIEEALTRYSISVKLATPIELLPEPLSAAAAQSVQEDEEGQPICLPQLTPARIHGVIGTRLWEVIERLPRSVRERWFKRTWDAFTFAVEKSHSPNEDDALCAGLMGRGRVHLANISEMLSDDANGQNDDQDKRDIDADATRITLDQCKFIQS